MIDKATEAVEYAAELAQNLADRFYPEVPQFEPLYGDIYGLLTQIDNMTTGLVRKQASISAYRQHLADEGMVIALNSPQETLILMGLLIYAVT
jgi:hypothetical protein